MTPRDSPPFTQPAFETDSAEPRPRPIGMRNGNVAGADGRRAVPRRAQHYFQRIVNLIETGIVLVDERAQVEWRNAAAARILGAQAQDLVDDLAGRADTLGICDADGSPIRADARPIAYTRLTGSAVQDRVIGLDLPEGQWVWLLVSCCLLEPGDQARSPLLLSFTDITSGHATSKRLAHQATHDALTGLPNRAYVLGRMTRALDSGNREALAAVLFIDLDNLKLINDSLGHDAGDTALQVVAQRLRSAVRADDVIARFGGDEFVALLVGPITAIDLDRLAERLHAKLAEPAIIAGILVRLRASVGIAEIERDEQRAANEILRDADLAMYHAKATSRGGSQRFAAHLRDGARQPQAIETTSSAGLEPTGMSAKSAAAVPEAKR